MGVVVVGVGPPTCNLRQTCGNNSFLGFGKSISGLGQNLQGSLAHIFGDFNHADVRFVGAGRT